MTTAEILRQALLELSVIDPIDPTPPNLETMALARFNLLIDLWNVKEVASYTKTYSTFTTTIGLSPHTIGPDTATWTVAQRPMEILAANRLEGSDTGLVRFPIAISDADWWFNEGLPNIQTSIPTNLYYSPTWPNGSIYFWPVPSAAVEIELMTRFVLSQVAEADITAELEMPPGYATALMLTLAEDLPFGVQLPSLPVRARNARAVIFGQNNKPQRITVRDAGMPGSGAWQDGGFNYSTRIGGGARW